MGIPEAICTSASIAFVVQDRDFAKRFTGSLRLRCFGARNLIEDGSQQTALTAFVGPVVGHFVEGEDRHQSFPLPASLDDYD